MKRFFSPEPHVALVKSFSTPFRNAIATARTCYSAKGIVDDEQVDPIKSIPLAKNIYAAGHHTTFQHAQLQFKLSNISRQFIWSFLHSHPFYNSEQVSQRYVAVKEGNYAIPPLSKEERAIYISTVEKLFRRYRELTDILIEPTSSAYFSLFPSRKKYQEKYETAIRRKALETARYVLPVCMFGYMYHTISALTLMRYYRLCLSYDAPFEQQLVVRKMVECLLAHDRGYFAVLEEPIEIEQTQEYRCFHEIGVSDSSVSSRDFLKCFDQSLCGLTSKLIDYKMNAEAVLAESVRETLGIPAQRITDDEAIEWLLNPGKNTLLSESLVLTTHSKISRAMYHAHYTFRKKISHAADSQDQRHRMVPASRPLLSAHVTNDPDYIIPVIINSNESMTRFYSDSMEIAWEGARKLKEKGAPMEFVMYLLPNALSIRYTESADLLNLRHKLAMRLCYNAQEEIWNASLDEAMQIREIHPRIGKYLLPPCAIRDRSGVRPICPEGDRYCGVKVWQMNPENYNRII